jgi:hypothetical protein
MWCHRIMLESFLQKDNAFVTLTYADDHLPKSSGSLATLNARDVQLWLKRLRKVVRSTRIRYFLVGEYGDVTERPHYHAALFGFPACAYGRSMFSRVNSNCCVACNTIRDTWKLGHVCVSGLGYESASYISGYVVKKLTRSDDVRLKGRVPEFARMSSCPGIGRDALHEVGSEVLRYDVNGKLGDVPTGLRHGRRVLPLGRYLRRQLRVICGEAEGAPQVTLDEMAEKVRPMYEAASLVAREAPAVVRKEVEAAQFAQNLVDEAEGAVARLKAREQIRKQRRPL